MKQIFHAALCALTGEQSSKTDLGFMDFDLEYAGEATYWYFSDLNDKLMIVSKELYIDQPFWKKNSK